MDREKDARYCTICGKRIVPHAKIQPYTSGNTTISGTLYLSDGTEPICTGHKIAGYGPSIRVKREPIPQAFYDAFNDEEWTE